MLCHHRIGWLTAGPLRQTGLVTAAPRQSKRLAVAEELMVLVIPAEAAADVGEVGNELDSAQQLDLLEAESVSLLSRTGAPGPKLSGSPFMSQASMVRGLRIWAMECAS
jgi:hypothetical protein